MRQAALRLLLNDFKKSLKLLGKRRSAGNTQSKEIIDL